MNNVFYCFDKDGFWCLRNDKGAFASPSFKSFKDLLVWVIAKGS